MNRQVVIPAGGMGKRLGESLPKALVPLCGEALLLRTLSAFATLGLADTAVIAIPDGYRDTFEGLLAGAFPGNKITLVDGGAERQDSVRNALAALHEDTEFCAIHDAARPFITAETIEVSFRAAEAHGAATVAIPAIATVLLGDAQGFLQETPDRDAVWFCQTPQTFRVDIIRAAHDEALAKEFQGTDDATLVRRCGHAVKLVHGAPTNIKVTTPTDITIAEAFIEKGFPCA
ncbi:MAG: 2-C-methyl-D-erythritol 4-phosphate cytidylyltransferase [Candidatus Hydrogenedentes bacterium]|nr:2-C-methyl-D-erythritol 4-phosphate cytidylyltransferase [Candidatus Hydrogenedentota bacterium]